MMRSTSTHFILDPIRIFFSSWLLMAILMLGIALIGPGLSASTLPISPNSSETVSSASNSQTSILSESTVSESKTPQIEVTQTDLAKQSDTSDTLVYYNQKDSAWRDLPYGEDHIGGYGCGPTVCAMILSSMTSKLVTPAEMADWSVKNGCYINGGGSYHTLIPYACQSYGLQVEGCTAEDRQTIIRALQDGAMVAVIMGPGDFTTSGHFILLSGLTEDGKFLVADPASRENTRAWDPEIIFTQAKRYAAAGGPFWIITAS